MLKKLWQKIRQICWGHQGKVHTFTYYIPAPPPRKSGYREKEFDKIFHHFLSQGYEVLDQQLAPHHGPQQSGMWVMFVVRSLRPENDAFNPNFPAIKEDQTESPATSSHESDPESVAFLKDIYYE